MAGVAWAVLASSALVAGAVDPPACTEAMAGGEWATYGADLHGSQRQDLEDVIGVGNVAGLERAWITGDTGYQSPAPIVSGGCVFINTGGAIEALDLETGTTVWRSTGADTGGTFAATVVDGRVHIGLNNGAHPKAAAFDVRDGHLLWESDEIYFGQPTTQQSSAIVHNGIQVLFTTGPDFEPSARQGYGLIDAATGAILYEATTIPAADLEAGYSGGGVWGTPSVDPITNYLYVGTSNPESKTKEHAYDNAIIKIDLDRTPGDLRSDRRLVQGNTRQHHGLRQPRLPEPGRDGVGEPRNLRVLADLRPARRRLRRRADAVAQRRGPSARRSDAEVGMDARLRRRDDGAGLGPAAVRHHVVPRREHRAHRDRRRDALRGLQSRRAPRARR